METLGFSEDHGGAWRNRSALTLHPGDWRMRNGHTARLTKLMEIPYKDVRSGKSMIFPVWAGECVECGAPMTWNLNGCYAAAGSHRSDITGKV